MSTGEDILARAMDEALASAIRNSAAGLVRSGVVTNAQLFRKTEPEALAMNEAALAFDYDTLDREEAELKQYREAKSGELRMMMTRLQLSPELRAEIEAAIQSLGGATTKQAVDALAQTISHQIQDASQYTTSQTTLNDQEAREQKLLAEWNAYKDFSQNIRNEFRENGYVDTPENEKKLADLWAKMDELEPGSKEWLDVKKQIEHMDLDYFQWVKEEAMKRIPPDWETVRKAEAAIENTHTGQEKWKEMTTEADKQGQGKVTDTTASIFDDEPTFTQAAPVKKSAAEATAKVQPQEDFAELGNLSPSIVSNTSPSGGRGIG